MFDFLRARFRQRVHPASLTPNESGLPQRFRGKPVIAERHADFGTKEGGSEGKSIPEHRGRALPVID
jgi:hypothetical protein